MATITKLKNFIKQNQLISTADKVLLAISGGKDSMLMACLLHDLGYQCIVAHCNFHLRGQDADLDEALVKEYAESLGYEFFVNHFDTQRYAQQHRVSIQMAARELRYEWFERLRQEQGCSVISIAQHQRDNIETALLNLTRSTGLQGLLGISEKRNHIIRPMLNFSAEEITKTVLEYNVPFRDDQSNFSSKYARNKIRLEIIPKFEEIQPDFQQIMLRNMAHFKESHDYLTSHFDSIRSSIFSIKDDLIQIEKEAIRPFIDKPYVLFELFKPFHFRKEVLEDLGSCFDRQMGQVFQSPSHEILLDRDQLLVRQRTSTIKWNIFLDPGVTHVQLEDRVLKFSYDDIVSLSKNPDIAHIDADLLIFPLHIRSWQFGDIFTPLGMEGKKKLSDFFIQQKLNKFQKEQVALLVNGDGQIIWIIGHRIDNQFKVTENTKKVLTLVFN